MRIVSLLPSATEIVYALGLDGPALGVTDECDWRRAARDKRVVVRSRQPSGMTPGQIDDVGPRRGAERRAVPARRRRPSPRSRRELLLTQDLCRVCAVPTGDVDAALARIGCPATVVTLEPQRLDEVIASSGTWPMRLASDRDAGSLPGCMTVPGAVRMPSLAARRCRRSSSSGSTRPSPPATGFRTSSPLPAASRCSAIPVGGRGRRPGTRRCAPTPRLSSLRHAARRRSMRWRRPAGSCRPSSCAAGSSQSTSPDPGPRLVDCVEALASVLHPGAGPAARPDVVLVR